MKSVEQKIFELVDKQGDLLNGSIHIIDQTEQYPEFEGERKYRIYHNAGYCIDVEKKCDAYNEETNKPKTWEYSVVQEWPEFAKIDENLLLSLLKTELKFTL